MLCVVPVVKMLANRSPLAPGPNGGSAFRLQTQNGERVRAPVVGVYLQAKPLDRMFVFDNGRVEIHSSSAAVCGLLAMAGPVHRSELPAASILPSGSDRLACEAGAVIRALVVTSFRVV
jgi:hypothetical protein